MYFLTIFGLLYKCVWYKLTSEIYSLSIYNVLSQLVQTTTRPTKTVDVSGLKTGNYILKVVTENGVSSSKFSKL